MIIDKFPFYKQHDQMDCGPTCIKMIAKHFGASFPIEYLREKSSITREGVSFLGLSDAAEEIGLQTLMVTVEFNSLVEEVSLPCIAHWRQRHFVVVYKIKDNHIYVADPAFGKIKYTKEQFLAGWLYNKEKNDDTAGFLLLAEPTPKLFDSKVLDTANSGILYILPFLRNYRNQIGQLFIGVILSVLITFTFPFLTQLVIDKGVGLKKMSIVYTFLIAEFVLIFSLTAVSTLRNWILMQIGSRVSLSVLSNFLSLLLSKPISFFESKMDTDIIQRIDDQDMVDEFLRTRTVNIVISFLIFSLFSLILVLYSFNLFIIFILGSLLYCSWIIYIVNKKSALEYIIRDEMAENRSSILQLIRGIQEIKLNNSEKRRKWEWESIRIRVNKISLKLLKLDNVQIIGSTLFIQTLSLYITYRAILMVFNGTMTIGELFAIQFILGQLITPLNDFALFFQIYLKAKISINRLLEIIGNADNNIKQETLHLNSAYNEDNSIVLSNLGFKYGSLKSDYVLKNINLTLPQNKITAIAGASGSGKTTLLKLLLKINKPIEGEIKIGNQNINEIDSREWHSNCGAVMQDGFIFADTILRNITESEQNLSPNIELLKQAVDISNLTEKINSLPLGFSTNLSWGGISLSGGENQRILIARAVYKNPKYLFFDEATSALDANNETIIMEKLNKFFINKTVIIVAHRLSTVINADQIVVMDKGEIAEIGNHESLVAKKGLYYTLIKNQLELGS